MLYLWVSTYQNLNYLTNVHEILFERCAITGHLNPITAITWQIHKFYFMEYTNDTLYMALKLCMVMYLLPITVAARSKARTIFVLSNTGIVGSNPNWGMDVCVHLFCVCVVLCAGSGLATGWSPVQGILPTVCRLRNWKSGQGRQGL
jgi:hypothetical protein